LAALAASTESFTRLGARFVLDLSVSFFCSSFINSEHRAADKAYQVRLTKHTIGGFSPQRKNVLADVPSKDSSPQSQPPAPKRWPMGKAVVPWAVA
jgi:hypothetical protein